MKRTKDTKTSDAGEDNGVPAESSYEVKMQHVNAISKPMASRKLAKKLYKLVKKASQHKDTLRGGVRNVQKFIRKGERGLVIFAGDVTPIEIMCHLPIVCEELQMPYVFTPSKADIGKAMGVKRQTLAVLIKEHPDFSDLYKTCFDHVNQLPVVI